ncbi:hypothetical protein EVAR_76178_1 [Eumeta japonica]|uniref:Uncharacterized protein n=1 Tax=Eumeta variegata TaxID=151549 RepID=A0A4C1UXY5_EUMVA|nr:hypothetical protein EVAR_76178_1 [Eumeta japonica]
MTLVAPALRRTAATRRAVPRYRGREWSCACFFTVPQIERDPAHTAAEDSCSQKKRKDRSDITQEALLRPHPRTTESATPT